MQLRCWDNQNSHHLSTVYNVISVHVSSVSHITSTNGLHKGENLHSCEVCCYVSTLITAVIMKIRK